MCSINFIATRTGQNLEKAIKKMSQTSLSRGPDEQTIICNKNWALAFNRLSIVGGKNGSQPIYNEDKSLILVCNGEIFNYKEIKKKFLSDHIFRTTSDTEVILHLYEKYKEKCLGFLEGQFAFIIYDLKRETVFVARDKFGILPLFIYIGSGELVISSSIFSILSSGKVKNKKINESAIADILFFYGPRGTKTILEEVSQLPPSTYSYISINSGFKPTKYWNFQGKKEKITLKHAIFSSVKKRIDKKGFGVYVSGGIDSAIIALAACNVSKSKPILFSISFSDKSFDESMYQRILADKLGCVLRQVVIDNNKIIKNFKKSIICLECPISRLAPIPLTLLSQAVRKEGIKVVLCGEGADELFLGYPVFETNQASYEAKWDENMKYVAIFKNPSIRKFVQNEKKIIHKQFGSMNLYSSLRNKEIITKLSSYLLASQGDRVSMANSVEQRFPYLDEQIWNLAITLGNKDLFDNEGGKAILRREFIDDLPSKIIQRKKQGYLAPDISVLTTILKKKSFTKFLSKEAIKSTNIFDYISVKEIIENVNKKHDKQAATALILILTTQMISETIEQL